MIRFLKSPNPPRHSSYCGFLLKSDEISLVRLHDFSHRAYRDYCPVSKRTKHAETLIPFHKKNASMDFNEEIFSCLFVGDVHFRDGFSHVVCHSVEKHTRVISRRQSIRTHSCQFIPK